MSISASKWVVMAALGGGSAAIGAVPFFLMRKVNRMQNVFSDFFYQMTLTVLACTGSGVLLATTFIHMLPENRINLESIEAVSELTQNHFPLAEILTLVGFLLIYFLEEVAVLVVDVTGLGHGHSHSHTGHRDIDHDRKRPSLASIHAASRTSAQCHADGPPSDPPSPTDSKAELIFPMEEPAEQQDVKSQLGNLFALLALSFHSIMEGIAIGIQNSTNLWLMFGAIASHKFVISFCMGMELCAAKAKPKMYAGSILLFAILSPLGILIGSLLTSGEPIKSFPVCILESFTTGTLLYVVFFEILSRERLRRSTTVLESRRMTGFMQFTGFLVGLTAMTCLLTMIDHGHTSVVSLPSPHTKAH